jgi:hypothetical protein
MRKLLLLLAILSVSMSYAQKVNLKKGIVYFDNKPVYTYDREMMGNVTNIYHSETKEMLLTISFENNGTTDYKEDDFIKVFFYEANALVESSKLRGMWPKQILERMRKMGVVDDNGIFNPMKVENFRKQYHEEYIRIR